MSESKYISIPQLAKILNISRIAVYKKVRKGEIEAIKIGKNYAVSEQYVLDNMSKFVKRGKYKSDTKRIEQAVDKAFSQYRETFEKLGNE